MSEQPTLADRVRQILSKATAPLTTSQIYAADDCFEDVSAVSKQMFAFVARGEAIRTDDAKGKALYALAPGYVKHKPKQQVDALPGPKVAAKAAKIKPAPQPIEPPAADPIDDDDIEDNAVFAINDQGVPAITNGEGMPTTLEPFQIARLYSFIDTTAAPWSVPE